MNITSAVIENYKKLVHVEFVANGNHIVLRGVNGSCKSAILETLLFAFFGKELLPDDPIRHGAESSVITLNIGKGNEVQFTVSVNIKPDSFKVNVYPYFGGKRLKAMGAPATFLESIMLRDAADPQAFFAKSDKDQVEMLFKILPELRTDLERIEKEYAAIQQNRSVIFVDGNRKKVELESLVYTAGLPENEVDPAELMQELAKANEHNKGKDDLEKILVNNQNTVIIYSNKKQSSQNRIDRINKQIADLQASIKEEESEIASCDINIVAANQGIETLNAKLAEFKQIDTEEIRNRINKCSAENKQIRDNKRHTELTKEVEDLRKQYSQGLEDMKAKEQEKIDVIKAAKMPVEGLSVGSGCLMFPDPTTGELVRIKSLSTGQQWAVVVGILAAFLPAPDKGMRVLVVKNRNDLDEKNYLAMLDAANKYGVQLIMHQTIETSDNSQCEILIQESN